MSPPHTAQEVHFICHVIWNLDLQLLILIEVPWLHRRDILEYHFSLAKLTELMRLELRAVIGAEGDSERH